jgi:hypothetical protein
VGEKSFAQNRGHPYLASAIRTPNPGKKKLLEIDARLRRAVETSGADRNPRPDDSSQDRYPHLSAAQSSVL